MPSAAWVGKAARRATSRMTWRGTAFLGGMHWANREELGNSGFACKALMFGVSEILHPLRKVSQRVPLNERLGVTGRFILRYLASWHGDCAK